MAKQQQQQRNKPVVRTQDQRRVVIDLFARGYTIRKVRKELARLYGSIPTDNELMRLAVDYAEEVDQVRQDLAEMALVQGLASKQERVYRLRELAEAYEASALGEEVGEDGKPQPRNTAHARLYLQTLRQIRDEIEPLGINVIVPKGDQWYDLLMDLRQLAAESAASSPRTKSPDTTSQVQMKVLSEPS